MPDISMPMSNQRELPEIYINDIDLPDIASWGMNTEHYVVCKVILMGKDVCYPPEGSPDPPHLQGRIKLTSVRALGTDSVNSKILDEQAWSREKGRALSDKNM